MAIKQRRSGISSATLWLANQWQYLKEKYTMAAIHQQCWRNQWPATNRRIPGDMAAS